MSTRRFHALPLLIGLIAGCGGSGGGGTPTAPPGPQTATLTGTASTNGTGGCSASGHPLATGTGSITLTVTQASAARIKVQVCSPTAVNHATECTVAPFASLAVGESVTATLKGGRNQVVTVYPEACGSPGSPPASTVTYTVTAAYPGG